MNRLGTYLVMVLAATMGCSLKRPLQIVPQGCYSVHIKDFTKPCRRIPGDPNGDALCDGVRVHISCVSR